LNTFDLHQQIGVKLFTIIGFTPQLLAIIGYYWLLLLLLFSKSVALIGPILDIIAPCPNINYCDYCIPIIAINRFCWKLFALFAIIVIIMMIGINLN
jgi:hypothetical protein